MSSTTTDVLPSDDDRETGDALGAGDGNQPGAEQNADKAKAKAPKLEGEFNEARAAKLIENLRADVAKEKEKRTGVETASKARLDELAKLLGFKKADDLDPEKLAADLTTARDSERTTKVELAVHRSAGKLGGDPDALLDSRSFLRAVADLDPTAKSFGTDVEAAIKDALKTNQKLKAAAAGSARSGGDMPGGPGTGAKERPKSLNAAIGNHYRSGS
ncbi:hypothetical protein [Amycolatopsis sp. H20-H5]|uniref:hypothetical protein n=1 Tax=Amycolatopsis sp. H20-H5 TaxID=3046309 RepID=UPI002DBA67A3|nr:hypothetical protein [Amycolatopsis sp. H20-H5]MEC3977895.1 hypothetical protein [Amycolatopsis sp. H20-H5]